MARFQGFEVGDVLWTDAWAAQRKVIVVERKRTRLIVAMRIPKTGSIRFASRSVAGLRHEEPGPGWRVVMENPPTLEEAQAEWEAEKTNG